MFPMLIMITSGPVLGANPEITILSFKQCRESHAKGGIGTRKSYRLEFIPIERFQGVGALCFAKPGLQTHVASFQVAEHLPAHSLWGSGNQTEPSCCRMTLNHLFIAFQQNTSIF